MPTQRLNETLALKLKELEQAGRLKGTDNIIDR